jgi:hypothetical protein
MCGYEEKEGGKMKENFEETFLRPVGGEKVRKMGRKEGRGCIHILIQKRKGGQRHKEKSVRNKEGEKKKERERNNENM